jgi:hypothetical protein
VSDLTVRKAKELLGIEAKAEFYELKPDAKYLVILEGKVPNEQCARISRIFQERFGINVLVGDDTVRIFEFE